MERGDERATPDGVTRDAALPNDIEALQALLVAERAELARVTDELHRYKAMIEALKRHQFGRRSEKLDPDQLGLALEDVEQSAAAAETAEEQKTAPAERRSPRRKINRGALPAHLPRIETTIAVDSACPCCAGLMHQIGEDVAERLDIVPAQFRVLVTRRPKYACRRCAGTWCRRRRG